MGASYPSRLGRSRVSMVQDDDDQSDDNIQLQFAGGSAFMQGFFTNVEEIGRAINIIAQSLEKIKRNNNVMLETYYAEKRENEELSQQVKQLLQKVHSELKRINQELQTEDGGPDRNTANHRIKKTQHVYLTRRFHEVIMEYSRVQEDYRDNTKVRIQRQLQIVTGKYVNMNDVDKMIEKWSIKDLEDILVNNTQQRQTLNEVEQRHCEIIALEHDIQELHEIFVDMLALLQAQGEVIDRIEYNIESAPHHTRKRRKEIKQAAKLKSSVNREASAISSNTVATPTRATSTKNQAEILNKRPDMFDLQKIVISRIMNEWEYVAEALRYDIPTIRAITSKKHEDPKKCCQEFFRDWLTTKNGDKVGPKVWSTLLDTLKKVDEISTDITETIIAEVKQLK